MEAVQAENVGKSYAQILQECKDGGREIEKEEFLRVDLLLGRVNGLHEQVHKPRDQVTDAEALLRITDSLCSSLKTIRDPQRFLPTNFISRLLERYTESGGKTISWRNFGLDTSPIIRTPHGIQTMIGAMYDAKKISRKPSSRIKRPIAADLCRPEEVDDVTAEESTDTQRKVVEMFGILRRKKRARLERLVLNRASFSETVENIFALSFLVKDGRSEIIVDDDIGVHLVAPRNAPAAAAVARGEIMHRQFVFRFDVSDWKLMKSHVGEGEELMSPRGVTGEALSF